MAFSTAGGRPFRPEINVTPLIDVLLVLLITFFVVISQAHEKGLEAQLPDQGSEIPPATNPDVAIIVQVLAGSDADLPKPKINREDVLGKTFGADCTTSSSSAPRKLHSCEVTQPSTSSTSPRSSTSPAMPESTASGFSQVSSSSRDPARHVCTNGHA